VLLVLG